MKSLLAHVLLTLGLLSLPVCADPLKVIAEWDEWIRKVDPALKEASEKYSFSDLFNLFWKSFPPYEKKQMAEHFKISSVSRKKENNFFRSPELKIKEFSIDINHTYSPKEVLYIFSNVLDSYVFESHDESKKLKNYLFFCHKNLNIKMKFSYLKEIINYINSASTDFISNQITPNGFKKVWQHITENDTLMNLTDLQLTEMWTSKKKIQESLNPDIRQSIEKISGKFDLYREEAENFLTENYLESFENAEKFRSLIQEGYFELHDFKDPDFPYLRSILDLEKENLLEDKPKETSFLKAPSTDIDLNPEWVMAWNASIFNKNLGHYQTPSSPLLVPRFPHHQRQEISVKEWINSVINNLDKNEYNKKLEIDSFLIELNVSFQSQMEESISKEDWFHYIAPVFGSALETCQFKWVASWRDTLTEEDKKSFDDDCDSVFLQFKKRYKYAFLFGNNLEEKFLDISRYIVFGNLKEKLDQEMKKDLKNEIILKKILKYFEESEYCLNLKKEQFLKKISWFLNKNSYHMNDISFYFPDFEKNLGKIIYEGKFESLVENLMELLHSFQKKSYYSSLELRSFSRQLKIEMDSILETPENISNSLIPLFNSDFLKSDEEKKQFSELVYKACSAFGKNDCMQSLFFKLCDLEKIEEALQEEKKNNDVDEASLRTLFSDQNTFDILKTYFPKGLKEYEYTTDLLSELQDTYNLKIDLEKRGYNAPKIDPIHMEIEEACYILNTLLKKKIKNALD